MRYKSSFKIANREISIASPTYFIADLAANHDGSLDRACELIQLAKDAGADCVKFQHFKAEKIVSDIGFKSLGGQSGHQSKWKQSVFDTFKQYELNREWNSALAKVSSGLGIHFMTTPYDFEAVEEIDSLVPAYKIGSGDITWTDFISFVAGKRKPVILACGASTIADVQRAVAAITQKNDELALLQCNTNYTGNLENFRYINLKVLQSFALMYPNLVLGLSDHTPGHATVLGAITLGARIIEKHFTDDNSREGPDHPFSMNPCSWKEMVDRSRELEYSLGNGIKIVEENEQETFVLQRRCLRFTRKIKKGEQIEESDIEALRPAPLNALPPYFKASIIGKILETDKEKGSAVYEQDISRP